MKKSVCTIVLFYLCFPFSSLNAQSQISVKIENSKIRIPAKEDTFKYKTPVSMIFNEPVFKNRIITLYSEKKESSKIVEGKFGEDLNKKTNDQTSFFYEIKIEDDATVDLKDDATKFKTGSLFFKIDGGEFVGPINFTSLKNSTTTNAKKNEFNTEYVTGSVLLDAWKLNELKDKMSGSDSIQRLFLHILRKYQISNPDNTNNKFIKDALGKYAEVIKNLLEEGSPQSGGGVFSSVFSSIGGLDVTNIADGFAKFIVKRAKEELSIAFFEKLKRELEKYPDLKTVFPDTYNVLQAIDEQIYNFSNFIGNLRESFRSDLQVIDENLPGIIDNHPDFFNKENNFELGLALRTGCHVSTSLRHDMHPGDILDTYPTDPFDDAPEGDKKRLKILKGAIQSLQLLSESLKEIDTTKHSYWVNIGSIRQVAGDKSALRIYIGLLLQVAHLKYDDVKFNDEVSLYTSLNTDNAVTEFNSDYTEYKEYILTFGSKVNELNKMIKEYERPITDSLKVEQYAKYFKASAQFIHYCVRVTNLPQIKKIDILKDLDKKTKKYFNIAYDAVDLTTSINRKRYAEIVNHAIALYNNIVAKPAQESPAKAVDVKKLSRNERMELIENVITENSKDPTTPTSTVLKNFQEQNTTSTDPLASSSSTTLASLAKYGAFMANVINAKNSDEVAEAIEAVALPSGSSSIKKNSAFNISVQTYAGGYRRFGPLNQTNSIWNNNWGIIAPIGVSFNRGLHKAGSISLFASVFDIGAIVDYQLKKEPEVNTSNTTDSVINREYKIKLGQIFSPGAYIVYGFPVNIPLSFGLGGQYGPGLGKIESTGNVIANNPQWRWSIFIGVDIPIFNLANSSRKIKP